MLSVLSHLATGSLIYGAGCSNPASEDSLFWQVEKIMSNLNCHTRVRDFQSN